MHCAKFDRYFAARGSKSRNKVAVGEPAAGSISAMWYSDPGGVLPLSPPLMAHAVLGVWFGVGPPPFFFSIRHFTVDLLARALRKTAAKSDMRDELQNYCESLVVECTWCLQGTSWRCVRLSVAQHKTSPSPGGHWPVKPAGLSREKLKWRLCGCSHSAEIPSVCVGVGTRRAEKSNFSLRLPVASAPPQTIKRPPLKVVFFPLNVDLSCAKERAELKHINKPRKRKQLRWPQ